jgi:CheY-like chemotaxis protein
MKFSGHRPGGFVMAKALVGLKVLIVEDDYLIASIIEQLLTAAGCIVSEPIPRLLAALQAAKRGNYDAAVLDINLNGERAYPVGDTLSDRNIPYLLLSGYSAQQLPTKYTQRPTLGKPFKSAQLLHALSNLVS